MLRDILLGSNFELHLTLLVFSEVRVEGLETLDYLDNLQKRERFTEQGDALTFESEVRLFTLMYFALENTRGFYNKCAEY